MTSRLRGRITLVSIDSVGDVSIGQQKSLAANIDEQPQAYLRVANIQDDQIDFSDLALMPIKDRERHLLQSGDVLLCEGQSRELVGRSALYRGELAPLFFQNHLIRFRAGPLVDPEYALLVFRAYQRVGVFSQIARGATGIVNLGLARFRRLLFPLRDLADQRVIVRRARLAQDQVDALHGSLRYLVDEVNNLLPECVNSEILGPATDAEDVQLGQLRWPVQTAAEVVQEDAPIVYGILQPGPDVATGVPYVRGQDLQQGIVLLHQLRRTSYAIAEKFKRSELASDDVLLGIIRSTRTALVPEALSGGNTTQGTARLRPGPNIQPKFLYYWVSSAAAQRWLRSRMRGIDMPGLNLRDVRQMPVPMPPLVEQARISARLDSISLIVDEMRRALTEAKSLISSAETGALLEIGGIYETVLDAVRRSASDMGNIRASNIPKKGSEKVKEGEGLRLAKARPNGRSTVTTEMLRVSMVELGGAASPEELFERMELSELAVDSFYDSLRELRRAGAIESSSVTDARVEIRLR